MVALVASSRPPQLLADREPRDVRREPFPHLVQPEAIAARTYAHLAAEFPSLSTILKGQTDVISNVAVRLTATEVAAHPQISPAWKAFFADHTSAAYWHDVVRLFGVHFRAAFPDLEERVGRIYDEWRVLPRGAEGDADVWLDCQFVMNTPVATPSSVKPPHVDKSDKIFSALFYFRDLTDDAGGHLDLYQWQRAPRFVKHRVLSGDVEHVDTVPYSANTYVCFVNSPRSVHGVSPRDVTTAPRRYINLIAEVPGKAFHPKQLPRLQRWWYGAEGAGGDGEY